MMKPRHISAFPQKLAANQMEKLMKYSIVAVQGNIVDMLFEQKCT